MVTPPNFSIFSPKLSLSLSFSAASLRLRVVHLFICFSLLCIPCMVDHYFPFLFSFFLFPFYNQSVHFLKFIYFYLEDNCFTILNWFLPYINIISHRYAHVPSLQSVHFIFNIFSIGLPGGSVIKNLPMMQETQVQSLGQEDPLEESMKDIPVFLPGESHGQRGLAGYSP